MPEGQANSFESSNINTKWLNNIFENLKNLENLERLARQGCQSILDYLQIPAEQRQVILADVQYKNLKFMLVELSLVLTDLTPVLDENKLKEMRTDLNKLEDISNDRKLFVNESWSAVKHEIVLSKTTPIFNQSLEIVSQIKRDIIKEIAPLLYIKPDDKRDKKDSTGGLQW